MLRRLRFLVGTACLGGCGGEVVVTPEPLTLCTRVDSTVYWVDTVAYVEYVTRCEPVPPP